MAGRIVIDGLLRESSLQESKRSLRKKLDSDGYLYFKRLVPAELIEHARRTALEICSAMGLVSGPVRLGEGQLKRNLLGRTLGRRTRMNAIWHFPEKFAKTDAFTSVRDHSSIQEMFRTLLGGAVIPHPTALANWARLHFPSTLAPPMAQHQDFFYVGVPEETYSAWLPLGDCPRYLGSLAVARGSHRLGTLRHGRQRNAQLPGSYRPQWLSADFHAGDALVFHSKLVHGPLANRTVDTVRLAFDFRYCRRDLFDEDFIKSLEDGKGKRAA